MYKASPENSQEVPPCVIVYAGARVANLYCFGYSPPGPIRLSGKDANLCECRLAKRQYLAAMVKSVVLAQGFSSLVASGQRDPPTYGSKVQ